MHELYSDPSPPSSQSPSEANTHVLRQVPEPSGPAVGGGDGGGGSRSEGGEELDMTLWQLLAKFGQFGHLGQSVNSAWGPECPLQILLSVL